MSFHLLQIKEGGKKGVDLQVTLQRRHAAWRMHQQPALRLSLPPPLLRWRRGQAAASCTCMSMPATAASRTPHTIYRRLFCPTQGVSAMGGVVFFNLAVDTPNGDMALLEKVRTAAIMLQ